VLINKQIKHFTVANGHHNAIMSQMYYLITNNSTNQ